MHITPDVGRQGTGNDSPIRSHDGGHLRRGACIRNCSVRTHKSGTTPPDAQSTHGRLPSAIPPRRKRCPPLHPTCPTPLTTPLPPDRARLTPIQAETPPPPASGQGENRRTRRRCARTARAPRQTGPIENKNALLFMPPARSGTQTSRPSPSASCTRRKRSPSCAPSWSAPSGPGAP